MLSTLLGGPVLAFLALLMIGEPPALAWPQFASWFWYIAASIGIGWLAVFVWRFIVVAPYRLYRDTTEAKDAADAKVAEYEKPLLEDAIRLTCAWTDPPTHMTPDQPLRYMTILDPELEDATGGWPNGVGHAQFKLSNDPIDWKSITRGQTFKIELENLGAALAIDTQIEMTIVWKNVRKDGPAQYADAAVAIERHLTPKMTIGPNSNRKDAFFLVSQSHYFVEVIFHPTVMASTPRLPAPRIYKMLPPIGVGLLSFFPGGDAAP